MRGPGLTGQELLHLRLLFGVGHLERVRARIDWRQEARLERSAGLYVEVELEQLETAHVRFDRLWRTPGGERPARERERAEDPALDRLEELLLAQGAGEVGLRRRAPVLPDPYDVERLLAVQVVLALSEAHGPAL